MTCLIGNFWCLGVGEVVMKCEGSKCHDQEEEDGGQHVDGTQLRTDDEVMCRPWVGGQLPGIGRSGGEPGVCW